MHKIVDDIMDILQADALIQSTRIVNYDETPFHDEHGNVYDSPLTGNIKQDLRIV